MIRTLEQVPEEELSRAWDYGLACNRMKLRGRQDFRIPLIVVMDYMLAGECLFDVADFANRFGVTARTVRRATSRLIDLGLIRETSRTANLIHLEPVLEVADSFRSEGKPSPWRPSDQRRFMRPAA